MNAEKGEIYIAWSHQLQGDVTEFNIYWQADDGPEYVSSTGSRDTEFRFQDSRIQSATWYSISVEAVAGEETSQRSIALRVATGRLRHLPVTASKGQVRYISLVKLDIFFLFFCWVIFMLS